MKKTKYPDKLCQTTERTQKNRVLIVVPYEKHQLEKTKGEKTMKKLIRLVGVCVFGLVMLVLVSACAGVTQSPNGTVTSVTITGTIQSVNASNHSVRVSQ